ncbi:Large repetitive protein [Collimonas fungivorans Ter331]|uniref:Large repetitive protein n=2 Tax=Collimonas fungivorans TaxID=158899 RepID=G0ADF7_COLFT|nr:Large repetitive protein [Collimonas fungivorans Ter331]
MDRAMNADTSLAGNDPHASLEDAVFAALSPDSAHARPAGEADAGAHHEYTAVDARSDYDSGMMGDALGAAQAQGQRQAQGQGHAAGRHGLGQFNHGVLSTAGAMLGEGEHHEAGDSGVGHLALGGAADNTEKKPGVAANNHGKEESWSALHHEIEVAIRTEPAADSGHHATPAIADEQHTWDFIHEIPHPEGVHKIAPIVDSAHEITVSETGGQLFAGRDSLGAVAAPVQSMPEPVPAEPSASDPADTGSTLGGKVEPGARVSLYDNGALVDTVQADADGNWGASPQLGEGAHQLTAMAADAAGNQTVASNLTIVVAEQAEPQADNASLATADGFNAGLVPEALQGHGFAADFDALSAMLSAAGASADDLAHPSAVSEYAAFSLPDDGQMQVEGADDSSVLKLDSASQVFDLSALFHGLQAPAVAEAGGSPLTLALGDVLEPGAKDLFAADTTTSHDHAGATLVLEDLLADSSDWAHAADALGGQAYSAYQPAAQGLDWLQQYGAENQPA